MAVVIRRAAEAATRAGSAGEVDSSIAAVHLTNRLRHLDPDVGGLVFGRIDDEAGSTWHVGRRHVEDDAGDPVVIDWPAPVSVPFYRATPIDPLDLARRRRFLVDGREVTDLFDEVFDDPDLAGEVRAAGIPDPLLADLERARTGAMRDIVASIAAEQDEVIRADRAPAWWCRAGPAREGAAAVPVAEAEAVAELASAWTSVGVIVPGLGGLADGVADALSAAGLDVGRGARAVTGAPVSLVGPAEAKGLEFDGVVVVEPAAFETDALDSAVAGRLLYIALTRAVQELVVVHAQPLPADLLG